MSRKILALLSILFAAILSTGCIYSFTGSSLPSHLKTVEIPLFSNQSLEPNVADEITAELNKQIVTASLLKIVQRSGDASISGVITAYSNSPYTYSAAETRNVNVDQYVVRISADVEFKDQKKDQMIYKGTVTGEGIYNVQTQTERDGKQKAEAELVQRIMQNSVQGW
jgi:hypothetical protein